MNANDYSLLNASLEAAVRSESLRPEHAAVLQR